MDINWNTFKTSVFFVLGFSLIFSILGILLQTVLTNVGYAVQTWLARVGGAIIIFFGLYLMGLVRPAFLEREYKISVKHTFKSQYLTAFVFGSAFAVGWSPCVSAALGAILALSTASPGSSFILLMAYTLGLGLPFLIMGMFVGQAQQFIQRSVRWFKGIQIVFGILLVIIGIFIFVNQLSRIANVGFIADLFGTGIAIGGSEIMTLSLFNLTIAFLAGIVSFLSPCVLPLLPGFLTYLSSSAARDEETHKETAINNKKTKTTKTIKTATKEANIKAHP